MQQINGVVSWLGTYDNGYTFLGVLHMEDGYYNADGSLTDKGKALEVKIEVATKCNWRLLTSRIASADHRAQPF